MARSRPIHIANAASRAESTLNSSLGTFGPLEIEPETERKLTGEGLFVLPQEPEDVPAEEEPDPWS